MTMMQSPGPDDIYTEMIPAAGEAVQTELTNLSNMMHDAGCFTEQMNKSVFIILPKVSGTEECKRHRTLSLMSHVPKLILRVIMNRRQATQ